MVLESHFGFRKVCRRLLLSTSSVTSIILFVFQALLASSEESCEEGQVETNSSEDDMMAMQEATFDPDKTLSCKVDNGHTLVHGMGGRGYGLGATAITTGCYQWKVRIYSNIGIFGLCCNQLPSRST